MSALPTTPLISILFKNSISLFSLGFNFGHPAGALPLRAACKVRGCSPRMRKRIASGVHFYLFFGGLSCFFCCFIPGKQQLQIVFCHAVFLRMHGNGKRLVIFFERLAILARIRHIYRSKQNGTCIDSKDWNIIAWNVAMRFHTAVRTGNSAVKPARTGGITAPRAFRGNDMNRKSSGSWSGTIRFSWA